MNEQIQTVTELTRSIKVLLETGFSFVTVVGEISNLRRPFSGHLYFTLKDQNAQLKAVLFKPQQRYLQALPQDGMEVICRGRLSVYEQRGDYQLIVDHLDHKGAGSLQLAFEELKKKLADQGLFAEKLKKPLPLLPKNVILITSPQGAAIHDFLTMAEKRFAAVPIRIMPVRVQGEGAGAEIAEAIRLANTNQLGDVIVLCRGGGSIEDLWAFNEERVALAIAASEIPLVSAIGHEVDFTIADFVADLRAPTPTAAAEMVLPDRALLGKRIEGLQKILRAELNNKISDLDQRVQANRRILRDPTILLDHFRLATDHRFTLLRHAFGNKIQDERNKLGHVSSQLATHNPQHRIEQRLKWTGELNRRLSAAINHQLERKKTNFKLGASLLDAVSPLAILGRGYSIVQRQREIIRRADQVRAGDRLNITLHQGNIDCTVTVSIPATDKKSA
ncbi:MAG: exodeoxyribonuclease VII large subunit [Desulfobulbaceae bacterium]|nr:exodeoxyribonuclease VII large subunit [Desulfobulbaceae bacterium]HIJ78855.1 exodeoxyribonuclease VII large subunit [Deltaproteobacteria bacterium]